MRAIAVFFAAAVLWATGLASAAAEEIPEPATPEERVLKEYLLEHSPFEGWQVLGNWDGPARLVFKKRAGVFYAIWRDSNKEGDELSYAKQFVVFFEDGTSFTIRRTGDVRWDELRLERSESGLEGYKDHQNGQVLVKLTASAPASGDEEAAPNPQETLGVKTKADLAQYLVENSPFCGTWEWGKMSGESCAHYQEENQTLFYREEDEDHKKTIKLLSSRLLRHDYPGPDKRGTAQKELQADGALKGVQIYNKNYVVEIVSTPSHP